MIEIILNTHGKTECLHIQNLTQKPLEKDKIRIKNVAVSAPWQQQFRMQFQTTMRPQHS